MSFFTILIKIFPQTFFILNYVCCIHPTLQILLLVIHSAILRCFTGSSLSLSLLSHALGCPYLKTKNMTPQTISSHIRQYISKPDKPIIFKTPSIFLSHLMFIYIWLEKPTKLSSAVHIYHRVLLDCTVHRLSWSASRQDEPANLAMP